MIFPSYTFKAMNNIQYIPYSWDIIFEVKRKICSLLLPKSFRPMAASESNSTFVHITYKDANYIFFQIKLPELDQLSCHQTKHILLQSNESS